MMFHMVHLLFFFPLIDALHHNLSPRAIGCADSNVQSLVSTARAIASAYIDPFCSSYLHYSQPTTTVTTTVTSTTIATSTVKKGVTTITVTSTDTGSKGKRQDGVDARAAATLSADPAGEVLGYAADIVSAACSCLVAKPSKSSTVTKTSTKLITSTATVTVQETKTVTVTTKLSQTTRTTTKGQTMTMTMTMTMTTTTMSKSTQTAKASSTTKTSSIKSTSTTKTSSKKSSTSSKTSSSTTTTQSYAPGPTFYIQLKDYNPARTDEYNNQYLAQAPDTYRGTGQGAVITTTPLLLSATLITFEPATGYIRTVKEGWYANVDYFVSLGPIYFDTMDFIMAQGYQPLVCTISGSYLSCVVPYPAVRGVVQTCPLYVQYYDTAVALGDYEYTEATGGPDCFRKNMLIVPA